MKRVSIDDLEFAITWLGEYEGGSRDVNRPACDRMIAWLRAEVTRREIDAKLREQETLLRQTAKTSGKPYAVVRARLRALIIEQMGVTDASEEPE